MPDKMDPQQHVEILKKYVLNKKMDGWIFEWKDEVGEAVVKVGEINFSMFIWVASGEIEIHPTW